jgi:vacuolar-type H+-ATPase subunit H
MSFTTGEVEYLAKDTMRAVNQAEQNASDTVQRAKDESEALRREAAAKGEQLIQAAVKEAKKRAEVLYGVARADGEKRKAAIQQEALEEQERLRAQAQSRQGQVAREAERIVLGHPRRR